MKANPEKRHLLSSRTPKKVNVESSSTEKLLRIQIDSDLNFDEHISSICNKVGKKINVPSHVVNYMSFDKRRMVIKAFIESQFYYCPLIWVFHSRSLNNKINVLRERALRLVYSDYNHRFVTF